MSDIDKHKKGPYNSHQFKIRILGTVNFYRKAHCCSVGSRVKFPHRNAAVITERRFDGVIQVTDRKFGKAESSR